MKEKLAILGALLIIILMTMLDSPPTDTSIYYNIPSDETIDADAQPTTRSVSYTYNYLLEEMNEINGKIVETYREYETHLDSEGNEIIRIPTSNYQYITYQKE
ncbi:hypothetical protein [Ornithinibacillus halotolerans]|uniref:Uncharacterized protein n=1 Tax=Ornithinibacillus halotolerans TaxID=1274357 RepID=A0A916WB01_9BACI|nr:hypothetical protein [Ornithinibacillus halotolerans]GGA81509.1 hypothetical protein GCM10008025_26030 [Ornithinibacillus halotolerans]